MYSNNLPVRTPSPEFLGISNNSNSEFIISTIPEE